MSTAPDGSPVEVYERLPELGEGEIVARFLLRDPRCWSSDAAPGESRWREGFAQGEIEYQAGGRTWRHSFGVHVFADEAALGAVLAGAGLRLDRRLDARWFVAVPAA